MSYQGFAFLLLLLSAKGEIRLWQPSCCNSLSPRNWLETSCWSPGTKPLPGGNDSVTFELTKNCLIRVYNASALGIVSLVVLNKNGGSVELKIVGPGMTQKIVFSTYNVSVMSGTSLIMQDMNLNLRGASFVLGSWKIIDCNVLGYGNVSIAQSGELAVSRSPQTVLQIDINIINKGLLSLSAHQLLSSTEIRNFGQMVVTGIEVIQLLSGSGIWINDIYGAITFALAGAAQTQLQTYLYGCVQNQGTISIDNGLHFLLYQVLDMVCRQSGVFETSGTSLLTFNGGFFFGVGSEFRGQGLISLEGIRGMTLQDLNVVGTSMIAEIQLHIRCYVKMEAKEGHSLRIGRNGMRALLNFDENDYRLEGSDLPGSIILQAGGSLNMSSGSMHLIVSMINVDIYILSGAKASLMYAKLDEVKIVNYAELRLSNLLASNMSLVNNEGASAVLNSVYANECIIQNFGNMQISDKSATLSVFLLELATAVVVDHTILRYSVVNFGTIAFGAGQLERNVTQWFPSATDAEVSVSGGMIVEVSGPAHLPWCPISCDITTMLNIWLSDLKSFSALSIRLYRPTENLDRPFSVSRLFEVDESTLSHLASWMPRSFALTSVSVMVESEWYVDGNLQLQHSIVTCGGNFQILKSLNLLHSSHLQTFNESASVLVVGSMNFDSASGENSSFTTNIRFKSSGWISSCFGAYKFLRGFEQLGQSAVYELCGSIVHMTTTSPFKISQGTMNGGGIIDGDLDLESTLNLDLAQTLQVRGNFIAAKTSKIKLIAELTNNNISVDVVQGILAIDKIASLNGSVSIYWDWQGSLQVHLAQNVRIPIILYGNAILPQDTAQIFSYGIDATALVIDQSETALWVDFVGCRSGTSGTYSCLPCEMGTISVRNAILPVECMACPAGKRQPISSQTSCHECTPGSYSGYDGEAVCQLCGAGTYQPDSTSSSCQSCQPGLFAPGAGMERCLWCSAGKYSDTSASSSCIQCSAGQYQLQTSQTVCNKCSAGQHSSGIGSVTCVLCVPGKFQPASNTSACLECPKGSFSSASGSIVCTSCKEGTYSNITAAANCNICPLGTFQNLQLAISCNSCPYGKISNFNSTACINETDQNFIIAPTSHISMTTLSSTSKTSEVISSVQTSSVAITLSSNVSIENFQTQANPNEVVEPGKVDEQRTAVPLSVSLRFGVGFGAIAFGLLTCAFCGYHHHQRMRLRLQSSTQTKKDDTRTWAEKLSELSDLMLRSQNSVHKRVLEAADEMKLPKRRSTRLSLFMGRKSTAYFCMDTEQGAINEIRMKSTLYFDDVEAGNRECNEAIQEALVTSECEDVDTRGLPIEQAAGDTVCEDDLAKMTQQDDSPRWKEFTDDSGRIYFFDSSTNKSVWEKPCSQGIKENYMNTGGDAMLVMETTGFETAEICSGNIREQASTNLNDTSFPQNGVWPESGLCEHEQRMQTSHLKIEHHDNDIVASVIAQNLISGSDCKLVREFNSLHNSSPRNCPLAISTSGTNTDNKFLDKDEECKMFFADRCPTSDSNTDGNRLLLSIRDFDVSKLKTTIDSRGIEKAKSSIVSPACISISTDREDAVVNSGVKELEADCEKADTRSTILAPQENGLLDAIRGFQHSRLKKTVSKNADACPLQSITTNPESDLSLSASIQLFLKRDHHEPPTSCPDDGEQDSARKGRKMTLSSIVGLSEALCKFRADKGQDDSDGWSDD